jgi:hypothetical protein
VKTPGPPGRHPGAEPIRSTTPRSFPLWETMQPGFKRIESRPLGQSTRVVGVGSAGSCLDLMEPPHHVPPTWINAPGTGDPVGSWPADGSGSFNRLVKHLSIHGPRHRCGVSRVQPIPVDLSQDSGSAGLCPDLYPGCSGWIALKKVVFLLFSVLEGGLFRVFCAGLCAESLMNRGFSLNPFPVSLPFSISKSRKYHALPNRV